MLCELLLISACDVIETVSQDLESFAKYILLSRCNGAATDPMVFWTDTPAAQRSMSLMSCFWPAEMRVSSLSYVLLSISRKPKLRTNRERMMNRLANKKTEINRTYHVIQRHGRSIQSESTTLIERMNQLKLNWKY